MFMYIEKIQRNDLKEFESFGDIQAIYAASAKYHDYLSHKKDLDFFHNPQSPVLGPCYFSKDREENYEELKDSPILHKYESIYRFVSTHGNVKNLAAWSDKRDLNELIISVLNPNGRKDDSTIQRFELTEAHFNEIIKRSRKDLNASYKRDIDKIKSVLKSINFDEEFIFYMEWY